MIMRWSCKNNFSNMSHTGYFIKVTHANAGLKSVDCTKYVLPFEYMAPKLCRASFYPVNVSINNTDHDIPYRITRSPIPDLEFLLWVET